MRRVLRTTSHPQDECPKFMSEMDVMREMDGLRRFSWDLAITIWMWCEGLSSRVGVEAALKGE